MAAESADFIPFSEDSPEDVQDNTNPNQPSFRNDNSYRLKSGNKFRNNYRPYPNKKQNFGRGQFSSPYQNNSGYFHPSMLDDPWRFLQRKLFENPDNNSSIPPTPLEETTEEQKDEDENSS